MLIAASQPAETTGLMPARDSLDPRGSPDQSGAYLAVENVSKQFGGFTALDGVSFTAEKGDFVCLLGPSGCGKTTLLRCIGGLETLTRGSIIQAGADVSSLPPKLRDFGIVFQSYALFPNLTAQDNVAFGLRSLKLPAANRKSRVEELFSLVGLRGSEDKFPSQLSGGQQQRVALARALAMSPGLLLLDEPLSALDAQVRLRLRGEIRRLQRRLNVTTIMVTHDQEEALTMANKIVVMNGGRIEQVASGLELYQRPANAFVAGFIGSMNFLHAKRLGHNRAALCGEIFVLPDLAQQLPNISSIEVCFRPSDVSLSVQKARTEIRIPVRVESFEFLGSHLRLMTSSLGEETQSINVDVTLEDFKASEIQEGKCLDIFVAAEKLRIFETRHAG